MDSFIFWTALILLVYVHAGYPVTIWLRAAVRPQSHVRKPLEPVVTVIVVAYNEAERIAARLENLLALDYPRDKMDVLVASDGSTDATVVRAREYEQAGVRVRAFHRRRGKGAVLNDVVPRARGELIVLADARQTFDPGAVRALVANFADPAVGAVSGELMMTPQASGATVGKGVCFYWRYEKFIRRNESRVGSTVGATGAIYAIRRALFEPVPDDTILDDVLIPLRVVRAGYRVLFEPEARAYDGASVSTRQEYVRKVRTIAGMFQLLAREAWLFDPFRNAVWFETLSHKALRLAMPLLQLLVLTTNFGLTGEAAIYRWMLAAQVVFYVAALEAYLHRQTRRPVFLLTVPYTICLLSWATIVGFVLFITHRQTPTWERVRPSRQAI